MTFVHPTTWNVGLNGGSAVLVLAGWILVRCEQKLLHAVCMSTAAVATAAYLVDCVTHYFSVVKEPSGFGSPGSVRFIYVALLWSHEVLLVVVVPMIAASVLSALSARWEMHQKFSLITMPLWLYVSLSGVTVFLMLNNRVLNG